jgi:hypothetical protein
MSTLVEQGHPTKRARELGLLTGERRNQCTCGRISPPLNSTPLERGLSGLTAGRGEAGRARIRHRHTGTGTGARRDDRAGKGRRGDMPAASPCSFGLSATSQQYFSLTTNQPPAISQQYFSLRSNQHQPSATSQMNGYWGIRGSRSLWSRKVVSRGLNGSELIREFFNHFAKL